MRPVYSIAMLAALAVPSMRAAAQAPTYKWGPAPAVFPAGVKMAVLAGDPGKEGLFTVRLDMPDGYRVAPHFHPTDENITVIKGTLRVGMGDTMDPAHMMTLPVGAFATAPAHQHHSAMARGHTIVQVHAMGPFMLTYVNPADDPSRKAPPTPR